MASPHDRLQRVAKVQLEKWGRPAVLRRTSYTPKNIDQPWLGNEVVLVEKAISVLFVRYRVSSEDMHALELSPTIREIKKALVAGIDFDADDQPMPDSVIVLEDGVEWTVRQVSSVRPAELPILFTCVVSL